MLRPQTPTSLVPPVLAWLLLSLCVGRLDAQSGVAPPNETAEYFELTDKASEEFSAHHFEKARALFERAHALNPNARTERGLGLVEFELGDYVAAIRRFEAALASTTTPLSPDLRADTEHMLERANDRVARVRIETRPTSAHLLIDGRPAKLDEGGFLLLPVGEHSLEVSAAGFVTHRRTERIEHGMEMLAVSVVLSPQPPRDPPPPKRPWYKSPWLWGSIGAAALAAAGTGIALTTGGQTVHEEPNGGTAEAVLMGPSR